VLFQICNLEALGFGIVFQNGEYVVTCLSFSFTDYKSVALDIRITNPDER